jgi:hypothetical protein
MPYLGQSLEDDRFHTFVSWHFMTDGHLEDFVLGYRWCHGIDDVGQSGEGHGLEITSWNKV